MSVTPPTASLEQLLSLDRPDLVEEWRKIFGHPAPRGAQVKLLKGILAWHSQRTGDVREVSTQLTRHLRSWSAHAPVANLPPGTRLLREWKGRVHQVLVTEAGFEYEGDIYKSLTAVTRRITQMGWSGPLFFGLRK